MKENIYNYQTKISPYSVEKENEQNLQKLYD